MLKIRTAVLSVVLVLVLMLTAQWVTARTNVVSASSRDSALVMKNQQSLNQNKASITSYRSPLEECFDVSLMEADSCRKASQASVGLYRPPRDECFDVSLRDVSACHNASQVTKQAKDSIVDECFDVSISELASCRNASQAPAP
jgi:hypothetical protein